MKSKSQIEFQTLHNTLMDKFNEVKINMKVFLASSAQLLKDKRDIPTSSNEEQVLNKYRAVVLSLFHMLEKTTDYVDEIMTNMQIQRKFSVSLESLEECFDSSTENVETLEESIQNDETILKTSEEIGYNPFKITFKRPKIPCGTIDASIFKSGSIIPRAMLSSWDLENSMFFIVINDTPEFVLLSKLSQRREFRCYTSFPKHDEVFGMKIADSVVRAVLCQPLSQNKVYLPDFGDFEDLEMDLNKIYYLTEEEKNLPGQAIQCRMLNDPKDFGEWLESYKDRPISFKVHNILNGVLILSTERNTQLEMGNENKYKKLSDAELEMLNVEESSTSNALKAVLGYVPQDDVRICRHYDPKTDSCFKGNNCRQLHVAMPDEYYTKDLMPANVFAEKPSFATVLYSENSILDVYVTHVSSLEYFYGIVDDPFKPIHNPLIWADKSILESDYMKKMPGVFDIVLAKFNDENWYRAQVLELYEDEMSVLVFYLDYGNKQFVSLNRIAKCDQSVAALPAQAQQFRLANIQVVTDKSDVIIRGLSQLKDLLTDKSIKVCVLSHYEDLIVSLLEEPFCELPKILEDMNCVKIVEMF